MKVLAEVVVVDLVVVGSVAVAVVVAVSVSVVAVAVTSDSDFVATYFMTHLPVRKFEFSRQ